MQNSLIKQLAKWEINMVHYGSSSHTHVPFLSPSIFHKSYFHQKTSVPFLFLCYCKDQLDEAHTSPFPCIKPNQVYLYTLFLYLSNETNAIAPQFFFSLFFLHLYMENQPLGVIFGSHSQSDQKIGQKQKLPLMERNRSNFEGQWLASMCIYSSIHMKN